MNIVLVEPEIPGNTGNVARLCAAAGCHLHLVHPLGFSTDDRYLKRAGLDYWHLVSVHYYDSFVELRQAYPHNHFYFNSTKAAHCYADIVYQTEDFLVFGKETAGLPEKLLQDNWSHCVRIPMLAEARSLNLSNAVAIVVYEALRQQHFRALY